MEVGVVEAEGLPGWELLKRELALRVGIAWRLKSLP